MTSSTAEENLAHPAASTTATTATTPASPVPSVPRRRRRSRFFRVVLGITAFVHVPVALGVAEVARWAGWPLPWLIGVAWAAAGLAFFFGRIGGIIHDTRRSAAVVRFVDVPYFIHWCAAIWTLVPAVVATLVAPVVDLVRGVPVHLPMTAYAWAYVSGLVVCGYGTLVRRRWFHVAEREVRIAGLDPRLDGLRIAQLSDLHIGALTPRSWGLRWARAANRRAPDIAVVTGDMVTSGTEYHRDVAEVIGALEARSGVFVSMGNHDYFGEGEPLVTLLGDKGVHVLRNQGLVVERNGAKLWLAAIDDTWTGRDDVAAAMRGQPEGTNAVLLAHDPDRFADAAAAGVDLVLSGHTHGGQIAVPFLYRYASLASFAHRYNVGFYRIGDAVLYVHPGLGTTGPPMRLGVAPEVAILVLRAA